MGIKSINAYLKKNVPNAFTTVPIEELSGHRVAIDASIKIWCYLSVAYKVYVNSMINPLDEIDRDVIINTTKNNIIAFLLELINNGITPIWISDGKALSAKMSCTDERNDKRLEIKNKVKAARLKLESLHILLRTQKDIQEFKDLLSKNIYVLSDEKVYIRSVLSKLGIPCLTSKHEGEKLCSSLAREGLAYGVLGNDSDNYALGTPILITDIDKDKNKNKVANIVDLRILLKYFNVSHEIFTDACIICGCDFNNGIPGVGPAGAIKYLKEFDKIEDIEFKVNKKMRQIYNFEHDLDTDDEETSDRRIIKFHTKRLNYKECKKIFEKEPSGYTEDSEEINFNYEIFKENYKEVCENNNLTHTIVKLRESVKNILDPPINLEYCLVPPKKSRIIRS